ncbi:MAG: SGNH/GDSL hydrolase family protein [Alphaproteobacteria bacterium]|nr:SGNH/GDSL hydrolase family protein [Alphaproteobacteria bacterium]
MSFFTRLAHALWNVAGLVFLIILVLEFGPDALKRISRRLRFRRATRPAASGLADAYGGADWAIAYFDEFRGAVRVDWEPYVEWRQRPFCGAHLNIDARGLRPTPGEDMDGPGTMRILCFGGSTMMGMGARDAGTIPAVLARLLGESGYRVAVTNHGQLGHNSTQETIALNQLLKAGGRPDIVLFYDGINEMACAEQTGRPDRLFNENRRRAEFNLLHPDRRRDLIAAALMAAMPRTLRRLRQLTGLPLRGPQPDPEPAIAAGEMAGLARAVVAAYAGNLRLVRRLAAEYGFRPLFFWQPVITTKKNKSPDEQRWEADYTRDLDARRHLYGTILAERRRFAELQQAADAIDLSRLFDDRSDPVYIDLYHLSEAGNTAVAEAMLPAVSAAIAGQLARRAGEGPAAPARAGDHSFETDRT